MFGYKHNPSVLFRLASIMASPRANVSKNLIQGSTGGFSIEACSGFLLNRCMKLTSVTGYIGSIKYSHLLVYIFTIETTDQVYLRCILYSVHALFADWSL